MKLTPTQNFALAFAIILLYAGPLLIISRHEYSVIEENEKKCEAICKPGVVFKCIQTEDFWSPKIVETWCTDAILKIPSSK